MRLLRIAVSVVLAALFVLPSSAAYAGSDSPTPYTVTAAGITLPAGDVFFDNQEVNISGDFGSRGIHLESKCVEAQSGPGDRPECFTANSWGVSLHDMAQLIGESFAPFSVFGLSGAYCVNWVQIGGYDPHYGEGGQPPVCSTVEVDKKISLCHRNQGSQEWSLLEIAESALEAHLSHQWGEDIYPVPEEGCPVQPEPRVTYSEWVDETQPSCEVTFVTQTRTKVTIPQVWSVQVKGYVDDITNAVTVTESRTREVSGDDCTIPENPGPRVVYSEWVEGQWLCGATEVVPTRTRTTIPQVWSVEAKKFVDDTANAVTITETGDPRQLSDEEQYDCPVPDEVIAVPSLGAAPPTCSQDGSLRVNNSQVFTWDKTGTFGPGTYAFTATAVEGVVFQPGPGVSDDGKTAVVTVTVAGKLPVSETCPVFSGDPPDDTPTLAFTGPEQWGWQIVVSLALMLGGGFLLVVLWAHKIRTKE